MGRTKQGSQNTIESPYHALQNGYRPTKIISELFTGLQIQTLIFSELITGLQIQTWHY